MEHMFDQILEKDEVIIKVIKPNKRRYNLDAYGLFILPFMWPNFLVLLVGTLFTFPIFISKEYKNTYYAYTNKRLIVRKGVFANSYKSLEYKDITSTEVEVGFWDKKTNTGTLTFVNPSSHHEHPMKFVGVENPYDVMRDIKEQINLANEK